MKNSILEDGVQRLFRFRARLPAIVIEGRGGISYNLMFV